MNSPKHEDKVFRELVPPKDVTISELDIPDKIETDQWGINVLENNEKSITVANFFGEKYNRNNETARVKINLDSEGSLKSAHIVEFCESSFAADSEARKIALKKAETLVYDRGIHIIDFTKDEIDFTQRPVSERVTIIQDLQHEGYLVRYYTLAADGRKELKPLPGEKIGADTVVGEPITINAVKNLDQQKPELPEKNTKIRISSDRFQQEILDIIHSEQAPEELHLPREISQKIDKMWEKSIQKRAIGESRVREYGAVLVNKNGEIKIEHEVKGHDGYVELELPNDLDSLFGFVHTHPYEGGLTEMSFSGADIASFLTFEHVPITLVQSGDTVFALVKSDATPNISNNDHSIIKSEINSAYELYLSKFAKHRSNSELFFSDYQNAALAANLDACDKYNLVLYVGKSRNALRRVFP